MLDCISGQGFRLGIEPRTYCLLDNYTTAVLTKYPHDLASIGAFQVGIFIGLAHMPLEIMIHTVVLVAYQEGKIRSKGHQSANYGNKYSSLPYNCTTSIYTCTWGSHYNHSNLGNKKKQYSVPGKGVGLE